MARRHTAATPGLRALTAAGIAHTVHAYHHDPQVTDFGAEAARALGMDAHRVFKTLIADSTEGLVVTILPVSGRLDLKALARALGRKHLQLADPARAERSSGYVVGGISPFGQRTALPTVLDSSALTLTTILVSAGRRGLDVEVAPSDLVTLLDAVVADITSPGL